MEREYRDSAGRVRTERPFLMMTRDPRPADMPYGVVIQDPIMHFEYVLDQQNRIAYRYPIPETQQRIVPRPPLTVPTSGGVGSGSGGTTSAAGATARVPLSSQNTTVNGVPVPTVVEQLGTQTFDGGIVAEGTRRTMTYPVGFQGNDRPINVILETWMSRELNLIIFSKNIDPRAGENTTRFQNLNRVEPDPALFQPPPDYRIVDQTGPVTITYTRP
jgi:hypothetical protein